MIEVSLLDKLLRLSEVCSSVALAKSAIYERIAAGTFPRPVSVGPKAVRWRQSEISEWVESRPRA